MTPNHILEEHIGMDATKVIKGFKQKKDLK